MSTTFGHFQNTTLFCIILTCISYDATNVRFTLQRNSLANAEVWRCIFICRVRLIIHIIVIQFPDPMLKSLNATSDVLPSISFRENVVHLVCSEHCKHPSHNLCGSCDLASKLNYVTGDEPDIDVSIALFRNHITLVSLLVWIFFICLILIWWLFLQLSPSPSINCTSQHEDTIVVKKFQHILHTTQVGK